MRNKLLTTISLILIAAALAPAQVFEPFSGSIIERIVTSADQDLPEIIWKKKITIDGTVDGIVRIPMEGGGFARVLRLRHADGVILVRLSMLWDWWMDKKIAKYGGASGWNISVTGILKPRPHAWRAKHHEFILRPLSMQER